MRIISFAKARLRPGSSYQLQEWNQLAVSDQEMLAGLSSERELYGLFQPLSSFTHLTKKVAYKEVALLYLHLKENDGLPHYLFVADQEGYAETISQLVLDSILEIAYEGSFVSGPGAIRAIYGETLLEQDAIPSDLSRLSMEAIRYALLLRDQDRRSLSQKLYAFNTIPWDANAKAVFLSAQPFIDFLFPTQNQEIRELLSKHWVSNHLTGKKYWLSWWKKSGTDPFLITSDKPTYKLYISPAVGDLPKILERVIPLISHSAATNFKIGGSLEAILRPDKMLVYFETHEGLMDIALILKKELSGFTAQGVPFTAQIDESGLLSWGLDPPDTDVLSQIEAGSWRMKVTDQLALAIIQSRNENLPIEESIAFIRAKLLSVGINIMDWTVVEPVNAFSS